MRGGSDDFLPLFFFGFGRNYGENNTQNTRNSGLISPAVSSDSSGLESLELAKTMEYLVKIFPV